MKFEIGFIAVSMVFALAACGCRQKSEAFSDENGMQEQPIDGELQNSAKNDENLPNKHFDRLSGKFIDKDSAIFDEKQIIDEFYQHHTFRQKLISLASGSDEERRLFVRAMYASGQVEALSDGDRAMIASWNVGDEIKLLKSDKTQKIMPDVIDVSKWSAELNRAKDDGSRRRIWEARLSEYRQSVARARAAGDENAVEACHAILHPNLLGSSAMAKRVFSAHRECLQSFLTLATPRVCRAFYDKLAPYVSYASDWTQDLVGGYVASMEECYQKALDKGYFYETSPNAILEELQRVKREEIDLKNEEHHYDTNAILLNRMNVVSSANRLSSFYAGKMLLPFGYDGWQEILLPNVAPDASKSRIYRVIAADGGDPEAQFQMAAFYRDAYRGSGSQEDLARACGWWNRLENGTFCTSICHGTESALAAEIVPGCAAYCLEKMDGLERCDAPLSAGENARKTNP